MNTASQNWDADRGGSPGVLGGCGYTRDFRVERYMREAKTTQIFEGTNQIQRLVVARSLASN
ncbi:MAG: acyl-CoA dehydrogenase family protein [Rhodococcus sp. (in: high G+C Gram-positive bacteria)]